MYEKNQINVNSKPQLYCEYQRKVFFFGLYLSINELNSLVIHAGIKVAIIAENKCKKKSICYCLFLPCFI